MRTERVKELQAQDPNQWLEGALAATAFSGLLGACLFSGYPFFGLGLPGSQKQTTCCGRVRHVETHIDWPPSQKPVGR